MNISRTTTSKKAYLGQKSNSQSGLKGLLKGNGPTKVFDFPNGSKVEAKRIIVPAADVETKTTKHPKNLRSTKGLSLDAVRDIYESIEKGGVNLEGIAIQCEETGQYLLLDSSRRRFCCIHAKKDLPLWVLPTLSDYQIDSLITDAQKSKKWSWREEGLEYIRIRDSKGFGTIEELAEHLGRGRETVRKRVQAGEITPVLIDCFPDSEGIPSTFYPALAKIERTLKKSGDDIELVVDFLALDDLDKNGAVEVRQRAILEALKEKATPRSDKSNAWEKQPLVVLGKGSSATIATSSDGRSTKFEFSRVNPEKMEAITKFIKETLSS
ncbi:hypothetical protein VHA01S_074_00010 [Vibrio halioticoli NBRC 102217]|uniref:ParB/Sulfiredoxin domain-containing protein n=1 Tax=Vibrio halioticoli NBRC 102217 TaxID=1219072 RepID=V5HPN2_9VIBR|nr:hypothetical protein [Vibrio halioticoli]GAD91210.1 hypothetical protein VHA01S_074_00010 [Vibrio halioticoli NBRC 102217]